MPNLDSLITEWRKSNVGIAAETLDELENHLRETAEHFVHGGLPEAEAFQRALKQLGDQTKLTAEFGKLESSGWWPAKIILRLSAFLAVPLAIALSARTYVLHSDLLLTCHVFTIVMGYTIALLLGAMGACYVCQRCFTDFSVRRTQSLAGANLMLATTSAMMTIAGVVLGMFWAKGAWGRYWAWDAKEIGGLAVTVWLISFACLQYRKRFSARGSMLANLLGNIVVSFAWIGPATWNDLNDYGTAHYLLPLVVFIVVHLGLFGLGFAPAAWLTLKRAAR